MPLCLQMPTAVIHRIRYNLRGSEKRKEDHRTVLDLIFQNAFK